ncbi:MAG: GNAT family N-acetyltransferase [Candidatus Krumholzibacteriota bacterium]|nr:GNAT family N-acetyltransferase [Candidatus Krumholzibacteriota bacterium]
MGLALERELDWEELDRFAATAPGATFYHGATWLRGLAEVYGHRPGWLTMREGGALRALLPFAETRRWGLVHRQSLPFGTYGGPLLAPGAPPALADDLAAAFLGDLGGRVLGATLVAPPDAGRPDPPGPGALLVTQILDLAPGWEAVRAGFSQAKRRQARKAVRAGVVVTRSTDAADLREYYAIYLEHARDWGLARPTPLAHLEQLLADTVRVRFWTARREGELLGGHLNFHFRGRIVAWNGTTRKTARELAPSVALYAANLEQACAEGARSFNFGGSTGKDPLFAFKAEFGARPVGYRQRRRRAAVLALAGRLRGGG